MREHIVAGAIHPKLRRRHAGGRGRELQSRPLGARRACARRDPATASEGKPEARASRTRFATGETRTRHAACTQAGTGSRSGTDTSSGARRTAGTRERTRAGQHTRTCRAAEPRDDTFNRDRPAAGRDNTDASAGSGTGNYTDTVHATCGSGNAEARGPRVRAEDDL